MLIKLQFHLGDKIVTNQRRKYYCRKAFLIGTRSNPHEMFFALYINKIKDLQLLVFL
ncbi:MAG: hypothetical protein JWR23_179 [Mucilaginibacter sp.]|nr:hypothetical protein [Mucilaginibacter sp.]